MSDIHDEIRAAMQCCEDAETVVGATTRTMLAATLRRCLGEIERLRAEIVGLEAVRKEQAAGRDYWRAEHDKMCAERDAARDALGDRFHGFKRAFGDWCPHEGIGYYYCLACRAEEAEAERDALLELLREVMKEGVEYNTGSYALVQMGHRLRGEIGAALAAKEIGK